GDSVALAPGQSFNIISSVTWKRQTDLALQWFGGDITCYRDFKGRCDLDIESGSLIINNLTLDDSGSYTFDINNSVLDKKDLRVIKPVPKPTVSVDCNNEKTVCNLTCEANITSEFGPVTYTWQTGDTELSNDKEDNKESSFSCMLRNPISINSSEEVSKPVSRAVMIYAKVGDSVVLHPGRSFDNITSISWGHEMSPILEWFGQDIILYKSHKGRSDLEKTTGSLIIHNLTVEDTGRYTPEINRLSHNPVVLQVIEPVPKPMVHLKCNPRKTLCDLTCKANTSSRFGPVMYRWEAGNKVVSTDNQLSLTTKNQSRAYTCKVKNPVSTSSSDEVATPIKFIHGGNNFYPSVVVPVVLVVLVLVVAGGYVKHRKGFLGQKQQKRMSLEDEEQRLHDDQELKKQSQ
uniref:Ig-like domain-containing protein n=1 Tax=Poecilia formosa TaxID=48698 RepID=A0A087XE37_POEFO